MFTKLKKSQKESDRGFTIIEVMIVLAIAGLILLIVFLAVPALQRNSRNTQRRSDASHLLGLINEYESNNNGTAPTAFGTTAGQLDLTNENFSILAKPTTITPGYTVPTSPALDTAYVFSNTTCNGSTPVSGGGARSIAVVFYVEPGVKLQCVGQ
jgi:prepilin-type N-terminal cleavage/methylation domain-containing protein